MNILRYANTSLLMETGSVAAFINRHIPLKELLVNSPGYHDRPDIASIVTSDQPLPNIGELVWPTGATRFSCGAFLCSKEQYDNIAGNTSDGDPIELKLGNPDKAENFIEPKMFALPPVRISALGVDGDKGNPVYLLLIVDERYFWPTKNSAPVIPLPKNVGPRGPVYLSKVPNQGFTLPSWSQLLDKCATDLGFNFEDIEEVEEDYYFPDVDTLLCAPSAYPDRYLSSPQLIDAVCHNIGRQFIQLFDGKREVIDWAESRRRFDDLKLSEAFQRIAGLWTEDSQFSVPGSVQTVFPIVDGCTGWNVGETDYRAKFTPEEVNGTGITTGAKDQQWQIIDTAKGSKNSTGLVPNTGALGLIAKKNAENLFRQAEVYVDVTYAGICKVPLGGYADTVIFRYQMDHCSTRVRSRPWNAWPTRMNHQFEDAPIPIDDIQEVRMNAGGPLGAGFTITANGQTRSITGAAYYSPVGTVPPDKIAIAAWQVMYQRWMVLSGQC